MLPSYVCLWTSVSVNVQAPQLMHLQWKILMVLEMIEMTRRETANNKPFSYGLLLSLRRQLSLLNVVFNSYTQTTVWGPGVRLRFTRWGAEEQEQLRLWALSYGSFRKLGVPYFGALIIRILLFRVPY